MLCRTLKYLCYLKNLKWKGNYSAPEFDLV